MDEEYQAPYLTEAEAEEVAKKAITATATKGKVYNGHNFRYGPGGVGYMEGDNAAVNYCADKMTWEFPQASNRRVAFPAGFCGPLNNLRKAEVTYT